MEELFTAEVLSAVRIGILTDKQLKIAVRHYRQLVKMLRVHGDVYHLVWLDAFRKLEDLEHFVKARKRDGRCEDIPETDK